MICYYLYDFCCNSLHILLVLLIFYLNFYSIVQVLKHLVALMMDSNMYCSLVNIFQLFNFVFLIFLFIFSTFQFFFCIYVSILDAVLTIYSNLYLYLSIFHLFFLKKTFQLSFSFFFLEHRFIFHVLPTTFFLGIAIIILIFNFHLIIADLKISNL